VACGTSIVARKAVDRVGPTGFVVGVDLNEAMLCGDLGYLRGLFALAGMTVTSTRTHVGTAKYPSIDDAVAAEVEGTPLGERISAETYDAIRRRARELLQRYVAEDSSVGIPLAGHLVVARRPVRL